MGANGSPIVALKYGKQLLTGNALDVKKINDCLIGTEGTCEDVYISDKLEGSNRFTVVPVPLLGQLKANSLRDFQVDGNLDFGRRRKAKVYIIKKYNDNISNLIITFSFI